MPIAEAIRLALSQLRAQKLKSALTLVGIVISVTFLITVVSILEGVNVWVKDTIQTVMAANTFEVRQASGINFGERSEDERDFWRRRPPLTDADIGPIAEALPEGTLWAGIKASWAEIQSPFAKPTWTQVVAVNGDFFEIDRSPIARGRVLTEQELNLGTSAVVIGSEVAQVMFGLLDPIDRTMKISDLPYRVVGVLEERGSLFGESLDRLIVISLSSPARRTLNGWWEPVSNIHGIKVAANETETLLQAQENVRQVMRTRHKLRPSQRDDFTLETSEAGMEQWASIRGRMIAAAAILPGIGLVIGALVIMNIMLVAVAERTREIGIRKALGARRWDILWQFLIEAATLSTIGSAIGIAGGIAAAKIIAHFSPLPAAVAFWSIPAGLMLGAVVGIFAGLYPASRAARLDPIAALRFET
jgi:putative ABC transport system permease protein